MLSAEVKQLIARLDPGSFSALVESLLSIECAEMGMPPGSLVMSDDINENDEGLDALLQDVPAEVASRAVVLPAGLVGIQVKSTQRKQPRAFDLHNELRKPGPRRLLHAGGTYVLASSQDLNPAQRRSVEVEVDKEAGAVLKEEGASGPAKTRVWDAQTLADLCQLHPAPAAAIGLDDFQAALSLPELLELTSLKATERPFQTDANREQIIDRIRERARTSSDSLLMSLHGDPGAGKTRVVAHALDIDDIRDQVLYVANPENLHILLNRMIRNSVSRGILVADEVSDSDMVSASQKLGGLGGRWRIISVSSRTSPHWIAEGGRNAVLKPLDAAAMRELIQRHSGLPSVQADLVARVAEGYPELAFRLADELLTDPTLDLVSLARLPVPKELLDRALQDRDARIHLGPIALFNAVGFEDDVRYQIEAIAAAFELDLAKVEHHCELELGRFVSRVGRFRQVSPLLVAVWLATDVIESTPGFEDRLFALPEPLQDAFIEKLDYFGPGVPHLSDVISRVLENPRFRRPSDFDNAAGRLLRASAAIVPAQVAQILSELLEAATDNDFLRMPRRDLVWTCQTLLWAPQSWETAVECLYVLAQHENETWANNATHQFVAAFTIFLSGSVIPYSERAAWLHRAIENSKSSQLSLLGAAALAGMSGYHTRMVVGFSGGGEPRDWQPGTSSEYIEARRQAWDLLLAVRDKAEPPKRLEFTQQLSQSLRIAYQSIPSAHIDQGLRNREWSQAERTRLASGLRDVLRYEKELQADVRDEVQRLHRSLVGADLRERLEVVISTPIWELHSETSTVHDDPPLLKEVVDQLAESSNGLALAIGTGRDLSDQQTRGRLFFLLARHLGAAIVGQGALEAEDWVGLSAALCVADESDEGDWVTGVLNGLSRDYPARVVELLSNVELNDERVKLVLSLVDEHRASAEPLARLLFGARVRALTDELALRLIRVVYEAGLVDPALGMLDQWLEVGGTPSSAWRELAADLALSAVTSNTETMTEFHLERLVAWNILDPRSLVRVWEARMNAYRGLIDSLDRALTSEALKVAPTEMRESIFTLVRRQAKGEGRYGLFFSQDLALLSLLSATTSPLDVWAEISLWPDDDLRWALHLMDWRGTEPDPLVSTFLLSSRLSGLEGEAQVCFFNTMGVISGPMSTAFRLELERAKSWRNVLAATSGRDWTEELVRSYEETVASQKRREEEERLRFG